MKPWIRLARLSTLPTAASNILMSYWLSHSGWYPVSGLLAVLTSSCCLYAGGMILNDVFDLEADRISRPNRPLPAGEISVKSARWVVSILFLAGLAFSLLASILEFNAGSPFAWRPFVISLFLLGTILLYDVVLKNTGVGPAAMGSCRFLNVLLGTGGSVFSSGWMGISPLIWGLAALIGIYTAGLTLYAKYESTPESPGGLSSLLGGLTLIVGALGFSQLLVSRSNLPNPGQQWGVHLFLAGLTLLLVWRLAIGVYSRNPRLIQRAVITCIFSFILLDATFVLLANPNEPLVALCIACLLIPAKLTGRWISAT